jgi:hypothetical protein
VQLKHSPAPVVDEKVPGSHTVHAVTTPPGLNCPAAHTLHDVWPALPWNRPKGQSSHPVDVSADAYPNLPLGHRPPQFAVV